MHTFTAHLHKYKYAQSRQDYIDKHQEFRSTGSVARMEWLKSCCPSPCGVLVNQNNNNKMDNVEYFVFKELISGGAEMEQNKRYNLWITGYAKFKHLC